MLLLIEGGVSTRARCAVCSCLQKQALLACFFLLGMGLITFTNATKQAADYFNHRYKVCTQGRGV